MKEGTKLKNFKCEMTGNKDFNLSDYKGQNIVIYFYPRDNTPGCTSEGEDFRDNYKKFKKKNTQIFGVSKDTIKSHESFKDKFKFPFDLISDSEEKICKIIAKALDIDVSQVTPETTSVDVEDWDSLGHLTILSELENEFGEEIQNNEQLASAVSVKEIIEVLKVN